MKRCLLTVAAVIWALALVAVGSSALTMMLTGTAGFAGARTITDDELETLERYERLDEVREIISDNY